jgi:hypothetical protein
LPVELYGVVYIYNPVAMDKLDIEQKEADPAAAAPAAAEQPAAEKQADVEAAPGIDVAAD